MGIDSIKYYQKQANHLKENRDYKRAKAYLLKAETLSQILLEPEHLIIAEINFDLGLILDRLYQPSQALKRHSKALKIRKKMLTEYDGSIAESLKAIGDVYRYVLSDFYNAEKYYKESLRIVEKTDSLSEKLARVYYGLATTNRGKGDYESAHSYIDQTLRILSKLDQQKSSLAANSYIVRGNTFNSEEKYEQAIQSYLKGIEQNPSKSSNRPILSNYYGNMANAYNRLNDYRSAKENYHKALEISLLNQDSIPLSNAYYGLAETYRFQKKLDSAISCFKKCLQIRKNVFGNKHSQTSLAYREVGNTFRKINQLDSALFYYQESLISGLKSFNDNNLFANPDSSTLSENLHIFTTLGDKGSLLSALYSTSFDIDFLRTSINCYDLAFHAFNEMRKSFQFEGSQLYTIEHFRYVQNRALEAINKLIDYDSDNTERMIEIIERGKSRLLLESLNQIEYKNSNMGLSDSILSLENSLKRMHSFFSHVISQNNSESGRNKLFQVTQEQTRLTDWIRKKYPQYYDIKYNNNSPDLAQIQSFLQKKKSQIIEYYWGDSTIYIIGITSKDIKVYTLKNDLYLKGLIEDYSMQLKNTHHFLEGESSFNKYVESASALFDLLVKPVIASSISDLIIIPDGQLSHIPFESMIQKQPINKTINYADLDYLINEFSISYSYSISLLLKQQTNNLADQPNILAFGFSTDTNNNHNTSNFKFRNSRADIPGTGNEIAGLSVLLPGKFLLGNEATESTFKREAHQYDILHFALHGTANPGNYLNTKLIFKDFSDSLEDNILYPYELYNLNLKANLVVLSACETGLGKYYQGEGVYSLARAFAYTGCPLIVSSLWKINDRNSSSIMTSFYKKMVDGIPVHEALKEAKLEYLRGSDELSAHPSNWAAFIVIGNTNMESGSYQNIIFLLAALLLIILLIWSIRKPHYS